MIDCDFAEYRKALDNRAVKKNCTIPSWLNPKAEKAHIDFSAILQEALIQSLENKEILLSNLGEEGDYPLGFEGKL